MDLKAFIHQKAPPFAWDTARQIPWGAPDFSQRALHAHLSQDHDVFSRRTPTIRKQINWIHQQLLQKKPSKILDLACGPGLYTQRFAQRGHQCYGIDIAPAAIDYAREQARTSNLACEYHCGDILELDYDRDFDFVFFNFAAFNYFPKPQAKRIIQKIARALKPQGVLLIECLCTQGAREIGNQEAVWQRHETGLFCDQPYLYLEECFWNEQAMVATERYTIITIPQRRIKQYLQSYQAYRSTEYESLLKDNGFQRVDFYQGLAAISDDFSRQLIMLRADK